MWDPFSLTWEPKFQNATPPTNHSQKFSNFSWNIFSMVLTKVLFWIFEFPIFNDFSSFSLTWTLWQQKSSKCYSSLKSLQNILKLLLNFLLNRRHKSTFLDFWNFEFMIFDKTNFSHLPLYPMGQPKTSIIWKPSNRTAKLSEIWASRVSVQCILVTFDS